MSNQIKMICINYNNNNFITKKRLHTMLHKKNKLKQDIGNNTTLRSAREFKVRIHTRQRRRFVPGTRPHMQLIPESVSLRPA